jgi:hypothetical protein
MKKDGLVEEDAINILRVTIRHTHASIVLGLRRRIAMVISVGSAARTDNGCVLRSSGATSTHLGRRP